MTDEPEILPPVLGRGIAPIPGVAVLPTRIVVDDPMLPPGGNVPSGCWWVYVGGPSGGWHRQHINGTTYECPFGQWHIADNNEFNGLKCTDYPMWWIARDKLMAKHIDGFHRITERVVRPVVGLLTGPA